MKVCEKAGRPSMPDQYKKMREAFADTVIELARKDPALFFISADCGAQEREFFEKEGAGRLIETGIAEANSAVVAAALAAEGLKPYLLNFAYLLGRMYNQISQSICQDAYPVRINAYYAGVWGIGGRSHNCVNDLSLMRSLPNLSIFSPADYWETRALVRHADRLPGPTYIRLSGVPTPVVFDREPEFAPVRTWRRGRRCTILCHGTMVHEVLAANDMGHLDAEVVSVGQIKPFPEEEILASAKKTGRVVVVEEHSAIGGLGECVGLVLGRQCPMPMRLVAVPDMFAWSVLTEAADIYERYGISRRQIIDAVSDVAQLSKRREDAHILSVSEK